MRRSPRFPPMVQVLAMSQLGVLVRVPGTASHQFFILLKIYAHSRMDKRMEAQAKMIEAMGLNEETAQRLIQ
jgi:hypothetical protein